MKARGKERQVVKKSAMTETDKVIVRQKIEITGEDGKAHVGIYDGEKTLGVRNDLVGIAGVY